MRPYEIRGQEDEGNLDCNITEFPVVERQGVQAETPYDALATFLNEGLRSIMTGEMTPDEVLPDPANGTHWHFKVVDEVDRNKYVEYSVAIQTVPVFKIAPLGEPAP